MENDANLSSTQHERARNRLRKAVFGVLKKHIPEWPTDIAVASKSVGRKRIVPSCLPGRGSALPELPEKGNGYTPKSPLPRQSIPNVDRPSFTCRLLTSARVSIGDNPLFSARAKGIESKADANARMAYCSIEGIYARKLSQHRAN